MQIIKPGYYDKFHCIAEKCSFTCCRDWHIGVDTATQEKWEKLSMPDIALPQLSATKDSQEQKLTEFLYYEEFCGKVIKLKEDGQCPFLQKDKLCSLVVKHGEEALSHTCHTFPRQEQEYANRIEYALSLGCPEVVDLLWQQGFDILSEDTKQTENTHIARYNEINIAIRDWFIEIMSDEKRSPQDAMNIIFYLALDLLEMGENIPKKTFQNYYHSNIVDRVGEAVANVEVDAYEAFTEQLEIFLDITENYRKKRMYAENIEPLAQLAQAYLDEDETDSEYRADTMRDEEKYTRSLTDMNHFEMVWKAQESKIRAILCEELYAETLTVSRNLYTMVQKLQWLAMEYAAIKTMFFLQWKQKGKLVYEDMRQLVVVLFRMMGYSEDDIGEYLENSFESVIWEWGYLALIMGR